jgi:hypothetical protein
MARDITQLGSFYSQLTACPAITTTQTGPWIDLAGFDGGAIHIECGTYTSGSLTPVIQDSDDASTPTTAANSDLIAWSATSPTDHTPVHVGGAQPTAITTAATAINWTVGYIGAKRYIRLVSTSSSASVLFDAFGFTGRARIAPSRV